MGKFKVIIAGGRNFNNLPLLRTVCDFKLQNKDEVEVVCGLANGADYLGLLYSKERSFKVKKFKADWNKFGNNLNN